MPQTRRERVRPYLLNPCSRSRDKPALSTRLLEPDYPAALSRTIQRDLYLL